MTAPAAHSPDALCAEILAEARRESEDILRQAKVEAEKFRAAASVTAEQIRRERRASAHTEAARRTEMLLATIAVEAGRIRSAHLETLLDSVRAQIRQQLEINSDHARETLVTLAAEAIQQMAGAEFELRISLADTAAFGNGWVEEVVRRVGREPLRLAMVADDTVKTGVMVRSPDGFQIWDNRLSARLERLWPELRRQIALRVALVDETPASGGGA